MYGLPAGFDASRFVGRTLEQVSFTANTVNLIFDQNVSLTLESNYEHILLDERHSSAIANIPVAESQLMQLLGEPIRMASASADGTLILSFANGHSLKCYDDSSEYESYKISFGDEEIVV